jgi:hypothetical protein
LSEELVVGVGPATLVCRVKHRNGPPRCIYAYARRDGQVHPPVITFSTWAVGELVLIPSELKAPRRAGEVANLPFKGVIVLEDVICTSDEHRLCARGICHHCLEIWLERVE